MDLELKVKHTALVNTLCAALGALGIAFAMDNPALTARIARILVLHTIKSHHQSILKYSGTERNSFCLVFKSATEDPPEVHIFGTVLKADVAVVQPFVDL